MNTEEIARSLTGFDEIAIEQSFGKPLDSLSDTMAGRALSFVMSRREGSNDKEAYGACMRATLGEITDAIASPEPEGNESQPMNETGDTQTSSSAQD